MEVEILSRKLVAPSSPTPNLLRIYQISSLDQAEPSFVYPYYIYIYIYQLAPDKNIQDITHQLHTSLSEMLTLYYPLAGRFLDEECNILSCNDQGAEFVEAKVVRNVRIDQLLGDVDGKGFNELVPDMPPPGSCLRMERPLQCGVADGLSAAEWMGPPSLELASLFPLRIQCHEKDCV